MKTIVCEICATKRDDSIAVCPNCGGKEPNPTVKEEKKKK